MPVYDKRIGYRNENGKVVRYPSVYADGKIFTRVSNPAPTIVYLDKHYFVVLPVNVSGLSDEATQTFREIVRQTEGDKPVVPVTPTKKIEIITEDPVEPKPLVTQADMLRLLGEDDAAGVDEKGQRVTRKTAPEGVTLTAAEKQAVKTKATRVRGSRAGR